MPEPLKCLYCGSPIKPGEATVLLSGQICHWDTFVCVQRLSERVEALEGRATYVRPNEPIALGGRRYEIKSGGPDDE